MNRYERWCEANPGRQSRKRGLLETEPGEIFKIAEAEYKRLRPGDPYISNDAILAYRWSSRDSWVPFAKCGRDAIFGDWQVEVIGYEPV